MFANEIKNKRSAPMRSLPQWRWLLDEVFVRIKGETHYLWRAVDHEGDVPEVFAMVHASVHNHFDLTPSLGELNGTMVEISQVVAKGFRERLT